MNRIARFLFALWITVAGIAGSPQPCMADAPVTLRSTTEVHRMTVRLSDVFDGIPADTDRDIAQAPPPGKQATYDVNVLTRLAQKYQLEWKAQSLADHVVIATACARITSDMIREAVVAKMKELNGPGLKREIDVAFDNHALEVALPADRMPDFTLNNFDYDAPSKRFRADLMTETSSGVYSVPVTGRVTVKRSIPVLARRLESGTTVGVSDIDFIMIPEEHVNGSIVTEASQLIGHEVRRDMNGGDIVHVQDIIPPRFVTRGSLVTLKIETPFMVLTAQGKALQDGSKGDAVRVTNTQSNRVIEGTVESPGVVRIETAQKVAVAQ